MIRPDSCTPNHQATEISRSPSQAVQDKNTRVQNAPNPIHQSKNNNPHRFTAQIDHKTTFLGTSYLEASTSVTKPDSKPLSRDPFIQPPKAVSNGGERVRTDDPLLAKQVLSQLSYTPKRLAPPEPAGTQEFARPTEDQSSRSRAALSTYPHGQNAINGPGRT